MFELHITCSKDIDDIQINFADGTSTFNSKTPGNSKPPEKRKKQSVDTTSILDTSVDYSNIPTEILTPPVIHDTERPANVADELQNLDI